jgi:membrane protein implicated in regulation of membrane protease activity
MTGSEVAFVAIGTIGLLLLLLSFVLGEMFEHETELSHEVEVGPEAEHEIGSAADNMLQTPSWLSMKVITASMVGFGAFGYATAASGLPVLLSWPIAAVGFFAIGAGTYFLVLKPLAAQQSNSLLTRQDYVGCVGKVSLEVPDGGWGQVVFNDRQDAQVTQRAVSQQGALPRGASVLIVDVTEDGVVVSPNPLPDLGV